MLIAGKGHERGQYVAGEVIPFDDREVAGQVLSELRPPDLRPQHLLARGSWTRGRRVIGFSIEEIARITGGALDQVADPSLAVTGPVVIDSRQAAPGALFAALPGERADGHEFAGQAVAGGAALVLSTRPTGAASLIVADVPAALARLARALVDRLPDLTIAGITGSAGKTTTKDLVAQLIARLGPTVSPQNSFNNEIGHPLTVLRADEDTRYLIAEMSARGPGHIAALCQISPPSLGVVLCVGNAHAGEYAGIDQIAPGQVRAARSPAGRRGRAAERR